MRSNRVILAIAAVALVAAGVVFWPRLEQKLLEMHGIRPADAMAAKTMKRPALSEGWPETRAGEVARQWVAAFDSGEVAIKDFYTRQLSAEALEKKSIAERIERYHELRQKYGTLMLATVVESSADVLTVSLMAADASSHDFVFTVQKEPPYRLISIGIKEFRQVPGGLHH